jgi:predicted GIY-YIG superfamily endonuclease
VAYVEALASRAEAMKREKTIKKLSHEEKAALIESAEKNTSSNEKRQR